MIFSLSFEKKIGLWGSKMGKKLAKNCENSGKL
jgi:hypothetical protein